MIYNLSQSVHIVTLGIFAKDFVGIIRDIGCFSLLRLLSTIHCAFHIFIVIYLDIYLYKIAGIWELYWNSIYYGPVRLVYSYNLSTIIQISLWILLFECQSNLLRHICITYN